MFKWILALCLISPVLFADTMITKVITLTYIKPVDVLPSLTPLLAADEKISGTKNDLIVVVSPETLTRVRTILHQLDVPPAIFLVTIHQDNSSWLDGSGDEVYSTSSAREQTANQSVQVMNDAYAYVSYGHDFPVLSQVDIGWVTGVGYQRMQTEKGFLIKPELQGSRVKISIKRSNSNQTLTDSQSITSQPFDTTTIIPMNKWVQLAQTAGPQGNTQGDVVTVQSGGADEYKGTLYIKVAVLKD